MPRLSKIGAAALGAFGWTTGAAAVTASYLVVAGGGGGGTDDGGGGGGGGFLETSSASLNPALSYAVTVGAGGATGVAGSDSIFSSSTANGGGRGGAPIVSSGVGGAGGSGGGGGGFNAAIGGTANQGNSGGATGYGNNGASGASGGAGNRYAGGGGGAGAAGSVGSSAGGNGGNGRVWTFNSVTYAGGGGGGSRTTGGTGGTGGGGDGGAISTAGSSGTANLGGGGGGGGDNASGAQGGSGVVIISYLGAQQFGGGVVTSSGGYTIHTFNTSGTLAPLSSLTINSILLVAGGGGGATGVGGTANGGGAGAGGLLSGSSLTIDTNSIYVVTVGAGGATNVNGSNSTFSMVSTAAVGGGSGGYSTGNGQTGGSGGGASSYVTSTAGAGTSGQGFAGGTQVTNVGTGGGGGANATTGVGGNASGANGGNGGNGSASSITGTSVTYAGGGGGSTNGGGVAGTGGTGGGGAGGVGAAGTAGTANLGGGGGGGAASAAGGAGGSGIVIISYAGATQSMAGGTVTISGGNVIHTFTSSGYLTPLKLINNSLRTRSSASAYLSRTFTQSGNTQKFTQSVWCKRGTLGALQTIGYTFFTGTYNGQMRFSAGDTLEIYVYYDGSSYTGQLTTTQVFRDPAAWYHLVLAVDTTQATAANRIKFYVNGVQVTALSTANYPNQNQTLVWNAAGNTSYSINAQQGSSYYFDGYTTELNYIDGQQLTPNSFGTFNSYGVWQPITYGGSYGTNGFYLPFGQGSSTYAASFNGSSQRLLTSTNASLALGTNDFTVEYWVYFNATTLGQIPVTGGDATTSYDAQFGYYDTGNILSLYLSSNGSTWGISSGQTIGAVTTGKWYNVAITRSGSTFYTFLNGVQGSTFTSSSSISQSANSFGIGKSQGSNYVNGYISNVRVIIGTCLYTTNFVPSTTPLTAVTNTKLLTLQNATIVDNSTNALTFTNTGSVTTAVQYPFLANVTRDSSPAGNNWTSNNIGVLNNSSFDSMTDVPTLTSATVANYCVWNPLNLYTGTSCANGNLQGTTVTGAECGIYGTMAMTSGKFYWESTPSSISSGGCMIGIAPATTQGSSGSPGLTVTTGYGYYTTGNKYNGSSAAYGSTFAANDVIGCALDLDNGKIWWSKNGVFQASGDPAAGTNAAFTSVSGTFVPGIGNGGPGSFSTVNVNFGQQPFVYTPPSGFVALNTYNI